MSTVKDKNYGSASGVSIVTTAETALVTSNAVIMPFPVAHVLVKGVVELTPGTAAATATLKLYHGTAASGTPVFTSDALAVAQTAKIALPVMFQEDIAVGAGLQYTLSITVASASGNSTADFANLEVEVL